MDEIDKILSRGVVDILPSKEAFRHILESGRKIKIYIGVDPTAPQLHLGHSTNFLVLKKFQDSGHKIIILIGDFTGMIGDPTGKQSSRQPLTKNQVKKNASTYKNQISKILNFSGPNPAEIQFNSSWLAKLTIEDLINLMSNFTHQQMIERDMFQARLKEGKSIFLNEFIYPLLQGYDSVAMNVDAEMGGVDQTFNMLVGRALVKKLKGKEKFIITTELLINPKTGRKLMSKSEGNYVSLDDVPNDMYAKVMSLPDEAIEPCFRLCTNIDMSKIDFSQKPIDLKKLLASEIVRMYHSEAVSKSAQEYFEKTFQQRKPEYNLNIHLQDSFAGTIQPFVSNPTISEAKRFIKQGAVDVNEKTITDVTYQPKAGDKLKIGTQTFGTITEDKR